MDQVVRSIFCESRDAFRMRVMEEWARQILHDAERGMTIDRLIQAFQMLLLEPVQLNVCSKTHFTFFGKGHKWFTVRLKHVQFPCDRAALSVMDPSMYEYLDQTPHSCTGMNHRQVRQVSDTFRLSVLRDFCAYLCTKGLQLDVIIALQKLGTTRFLFVYQLIGGIQRDADLLSIPII